VAVASRRGIEPSAARLHARFSERGPQKGRSKIFRPTLSLAQTNFFWIDLATAEGVFMIPPMLHPREMVELLIAAHGLDGALYQACERLNALHNAGDFAGRRNGARWRPRSGG
jgi:hypothetical protein